MSPKNTASASSNYYPQFPKDVHPSVQAEARLVRDALYKLRGLETTVIRKTITANTDLDTDISANKFILWILSQDTIGGWTPTFSKNSDGTKKWKGTASLVFDLTANTYTALLFYALDTKTAFLIAGVTAGDIA